MEDWEQDDFVPPKPVGTNDRWEGEDEDDDVKDNWDDEEEEKKDDEPPVVAVQPKKKKPLAQILQEKEEKKRQELEEKRKQLQMEAENIITPEDALAEKLRRQKLQEESDLELAKETFGVTDEFLPKTKEDCDEFRKSLVSKITKLEGLPYYILLVEELCRDLALTLQPDDIKKITVSLNAIYTEKIKAQKVAKGKKKSKTKATINIEKNALDIIDYGDEYDDYI